MRTEQDQRIAQNAIEFMQRCDLKGGDVPAFIECMNWLQAMASPQPMADPTPEASDG